MRTPQSVDTLEELGRIQLSPSFFMRDFLYSEIANIYQLPNIPENPDLAIKTGKRLCQELLEPLNATFGRIAIRSAYRSAKVNKEGNDRGLRCASNEANAARHIWDHLDANGEMGATACIVVPWFAARCPDKYDWRSMAYWIHNHLPYSELEFFPKRCAFNISWHQTPKRSISSHVEPRKIDVPKGAPPDPDYASFYEGFPDLVTHDAHVGSVMLID